jgi:hypothetical protein
MYILPKDELGEGLYRRIYLLIKKNRGCWAKRGAAFGLGGGMLSIIFGALLWGAVAILAPGGLRAFLNVMETVFFVMPLPLMALGAYCLDLLEQRTPVLPAPAPSRPHGFMHLRPVRPRQPHQN